MNQPKKMLIVNILDILKKYSDEEHRLSQKDIADLLQSEYDMSADRKAIRRNLAALMASGYEIEYREIPRTVRSPKTGEEEENCIWSDFYLVRDFTDGELRMLIDSVLFSGHIPFSQRQGLAEKLEKLSSSYFSSHMKHVRTVPDTLPENAQLFLSIELLGEAISKGRQVSFNYLEYGMDKKLHKRRREDGAVRVYVVSPYQMAAKDGRYYLICNYDKYDDISNYRIDRISNVKILDTPVKPFESLQWARSRRLDLAEYMREHIYMFSSGSVRAKFSIPRTMVSDVIDLFGMNVSFADDNGETVTVSATVNELSMIQFAKSFAPDVVILSPDSLVGKAAEVARKTAEAYGVAVKEE